MSSFPDTFEEGWRLIRSLSKKRPTVFYCNGKTLHDEWVSCTVEVMKISPQFSYVSKLYQEDELKDRERELLFDIITLADSVRSDRGVFSSDPRTAFYQGMSWAKTRIIHKVSEWLGLMTPRLYRHVKLATLYDLIGEATLQLTGPHDDQTVVLYRGVADGKLYVRLKTEFFDGRFVEAVAAPIKGFDDV